jgi:hypothetical protein
LYLARLSKLVSYLLVTLELGKADQTRELARTKDLAYLASVSDNEKSFVTLTPDVNTI